MNLAGLPDHIRLTFESNFRAFLRYRPRYYDGAITLFRAEAQPLNSPHERDLGWGRVARSVTVVEVPGSHGSLLQHPYVRDLARAIRKELADRAACQRSPPASAIQRETPRTEMPGHDATAATRL